MEQVTDVALCHRPDGRPGADPDDELFIVDKFEFLFGSFHSQMNHERIVSSL
jgi:hypothetical protein